MKYRNLQYIRGEVSTLIVVGMLMIAGVGVLMSSSLGQNKNTTNTQASTADCPLGAPSFVSGSKHFAQTTLPVCQVTVPAKEKEYVCAIIQDDNPNDGGKDDILIAAQDPKGGPANAINWIWKNGVGSVPLYKYVDSIDASKTLKVVTYSFKNPKCVTMATIPASTVISLFGGSNNTPTSTPAPGIPTNTSAPTSPPNTIAPTTPPPTAPPGTVCGYEELECCTPDNHTNYACTAGSVCVRGTCKYPSQTPTPTTPPNTIYLPIVQNNGTNTPTPTSHDNNNKSNEKVPDTFQTTKDKNTTGEVVNTSFGTGIVL